MRKKIVVLVFGIIIFLAVTAIAFWKHESADELSASAKSSASPAITIRGEKTIQNLEATDTYSDILTKLDYERYEIPSLGIAFSYPAGCEIDICKNRLFMVRSEEITFIVGLIKGDIGEEIYREWDVWKSLSHDEVTITHQGIDTKWESYRGETCTHTERKGTVIVMEDSPDICFRAKDAEECWYPQSAVCYRKISDTDYRSHIIGISEVFSAEQISAICQEIALSMQTYTLPDHFLETYTANTYTKFEDEKSGVSFSLPGEWNEVLISSKEGIRGFEPSVDSPYADVRVVFCADYNKEIATENLYAYTDQVDLEIGSVHMDPPVEKTDIRAKSAPLFGGKYDIFEDTESVFMRRFIDLTGENMTALKSMPSKEGYIYSERYCFYSNGILCMLDISDLDEYSERREFISDVVALTVTYKGSYENYNLNA